MPDKKHFQSLEELESSLRDGADQIAKQVASGNYSDALSIIGSLKEQRDQSLYQEVGRLTRKLHESIRNFHIDMALDEANKEELSKMSDASERLGYVVEMTSKAANKTLDIVEATMPIANELKEEAKELKGEWRRLIKREMSPAEFRQLYRRIDQFLGVASEKSNRVYGSLSDILMAQDFQDLTGQVIQRVSSLVQDVEEDLVQLVKMAGLIDQMTGTTHEIEEEQEATESGSPVAEGPAMKAEERDDVVSGQDDVDDLLSSLGF